jgi:hypothetical protein
MAELNTSIDRRRFPPPPLRWIKLAAADERRMHPTWSLRDLAVAGYRIAFGWENPSFGGVVIMPDMGVND